MRALFLLVALVPAVALFAEQPVAAPPSRPLSLLLVTGETPVRLDLHVQVGGQPVAARWHNGLARLFAFVDRNNDAFLDAREADRLPSSLLLRQLLWGRYISENREAPTWNELDVDRDGKVRVDEVRTYYLGQGLGNVLVGVGRPPMTGPLTDALLKCLDTNRDGRVNEAEWKTASESLKMIDRNDDELLSPSELVDATIYPGAQAAILVTPSDGGPDWLPFFLLSPGSAENRWWETARKRRDLLKLPPLENHRLHSVALTIDLSAVGKTAGSVRLDSAQPTTEINWNPQPGLTVRLIPTQAKRDEQFASARKQLVALFTENDLDRNGMLNSEELDKPRAVSLKQLSRVVDRNANAILEETELVEWLALQEELSRALVLLSVLDHGCGLFEFIDEDGDGALSVREIRQAHPRLKVAGCLDENGLNTAKLPRLLRTVVSLGQPVTLLPRSSRESPEWFQAMDTNQDGDISRREWISELRDFDRYDSDRDGLLSITEAAKIPGKK